VWMLPPRGDGSLERAADYLQLGEPAGQQGK
jgi:hypothetical protein